MRCRSASASPSFHHVKTLENPSANGQLAARLSLMDSFWRMTLLEPLGVVWHAEASQENDRFRDNAKVIARDVARVFTGRIHAELSRKGFGFVVFQQVKVQALLLCNAAESTKSKGVIPSCQATS